jgi:hypothetical protein
VVIGGEFGRTPVVEISGLIKCKTAAHHNNSFSYVLAGGGVKAGTVCGRHRRFRL